MSEPWNTLLSVACAMLPVPVPPISSAQQPIPPVQPTIPPVPPTILQTTTLIPPGAPHILQGTQSMRPATQPIIHISQAFQIPQQVVMPISTHSDIKMVPSISSSQATVPMSMMGIGFDNQSPPNDPQMDTCKNCHLELRESQGMIMLLEERVHRLEKMLEKELNVKKNRMSSDVTLSHDIVKTADAENEISVKSTPTFQCAINTIKESLKELSNNMGLLDVTMYNGSCVKDAKKQISSKMVPPSRGSVIERKKKTNNMVLPGVTMSQETIGDHDNINESPSKIAPASKVKLSSGIVPTSRVTSEFIPISQASLIEKSSKIEENECANVEFTVTDAVDHDAGSLFNTRKILTIPECPHVEFTADQLAIAEKVLHQSISCRNFAALLITHLYKHTELIGRNCAGYKKPPINPDYLKTVLFFCYKFHTADIRKPGMWKNCKEAIDQKLRRRKRGNRETIMEIKMRKENKLFTVKELHDGLKVPMLHDGKDGNKTKEVCNEIETNSKNNKKIKLVEENNRLSIPDCPNVEFTEFQCADTMSHKVGPYLNTRKKLNIPECPNIEISKVQTEIAQATSHEATSCPDFAALLLTRLFHHEELIGRNCAGWRKPQINPNYLETVLLFCMLFYTHAITTDGVWSKCKLAIDERLLRLVHRNRSGKIKMIPGNNLTTKKNTIPTMAMLHLEEEKRSGGEEKEENKMMLSTVKDTMLHDGLKVPMLHDGKDGNKTKDACNKINTQRKNNGDITITEEVNLSTEINVIPMMHNDKIENKTKNTCNETDAKSKNNKKINKIFPVTMTSVLHGEKEENQTKDMCNEIDTECKNNRNITITEEGNLSTEINVMPPGCIMPNDENTEHRTKDSYSEIKFFIEEPVKTKPSKANSQTLTIPKCSNTGYTDTQYSIAKTVFHKSVSCPKFAALLIIHLFDREELLDHSCAGVSKPPINPEYLKTVLLFCHEFYPSDIRTDGVWKKCKLAIDNILKGKKKKRHETLTLKIAECPDIELNSMQLEIAEVVARDATSCPNFSALLIIRLFDHKDLIGRNCSGWKKPPINPTMLKTVLQLCCKFYREDIVKAGVWKKCLLAIDEMLRRGDRNDRQGHKYTTTLLRV